MIHAIQFTAEVWHDTSKKTVTAYALVVVWPDGTKMAEICRIHTPDGNQYWGAHMHKVFLEDDISDLIYQAEKMVSFEPDWSSAPEWANYHAIDADGDGCWYENEPHNDRLMWFENGGEVGFNRKFDRPVDDKLTLTKRPQP